MTHAINTGMAVGICDRMHDVIQELVTGSKTVDVIDAAFAHGLNDPSQIDVMTGEVTVIG